MSMLRDRRVAALVLAVSLVACAGREGVPAGPTEPNIESVPVVTAISPIQGPDSGGNIVTFSGSGFGKGTTVTFGGVSAAAVRVINGTVMHAVAPAHAAGDVDVVIANSNGRLTTQAVRYRYVDVADSGGCPGCWDY